MIKNLLFSSGERQRQEEGLEQERRRFAARLSRQEVTTTAKENGRQCQQGAHTARGQERYG